MKIEIQSGDTKLTGTINHPTLQEDLEEKLSIESTARTYGEEVYFEIPVTMEQEDDAKEVVDPGTITYWVQGSALAIPYGPTPSSKGDECRLAAPVNIVGELHADPDTLSEIGGGDSIRVEAV